MFHNEALHCFNLPLASDEVDIHLTYVTANFLGSSDKCMVQVTVPASQVQPNMTDLTCELSIIAADHSLIKGEKDPYRTMQAEVFPHLQRAKQKDTCLKEHSVPSSFIKTVAG